ncbi:MAG TPA: carboxypeptidase-like regulatory domain-containing protein [Candidatus Aquilonibacter sp.]|nr:carboxypeptidase-like regulatory domain-containing protein [Candidatus Aquilonibacter sp.]
MSHRKLPMAVLLLLAMLTGCSGAGSTLPSKPSTTTQQHVKKPQDVLGGIGGLLNVMLGDAPPKIGSLVPSEIDLGVTSVGVVSDGTVHTLATYSQPYMVNVLAAQTDPSSIGIGQYFSGSYQAVQFTFDAQSSHIVANGANYPITFLASSALSSAGAGSTTSVSIANGSVTVTVNGNFMIGSDPAASIEADFNALESLAQTPDGSIVSRPTLFAVPYTEAGAITGTVTNSSGSPVTNATVAVIDADGHVANTGNTDSTGSYSIHTLWAGNYHLVVYNVYTTATGQTLTAQGNSSSAQSVDGPSITVNDQETTQAPVIQD